MDITSTHLEAALIDQHAAGTFADKAYAFTAVFAPDEGWQLGIAVANEPGYNPIHGKAFDTWDAASEWADGLNEHIGLSAAQAFAIISSTMGGQPVVTVPR